MRKVITYGTFDLLHEGHLRLFERAKELGDYLIVAVSTDEFSNYPKIADGQGQPPYVGRFLTCRIIFGQVVSGSIGKYVRNKDDGSNELLGFAGLSSGVIRYENPLNPTES